MFEWLLKIDAVVFLFLNRTCSNPVFDWFMPIITDSHNWRIPIVLIMLSLLIFGKKKGRITAFYVVVMITVSDQLSSSVLKPLIGRVRPCFVLENVHLLINQSRSLSFPSSHATNMGSMATLFSIQYPKYKWIFIGIAAVVSYSRIAVGVHYPLDILGGAILGFLCAFTTLQLLWWIHSVFIKWRSRKDTE